MRAAIGPRIATVSASAAPGVGVPRRAAPPLARDLGSGLGLGLALSAALSARLRRL